MAVQKEVLDLIDTIHDSTALTILFVTHDFNLLPASMGRVVLLREGRKVFDGATGKGLSGGSLTRLFDYPLETFQHSGRRFVSYG
jgi:ABC-type cobalamin/Fe3+-siderophores transport system ATPase subunit